MSNIIELQINALIDVLRIKEQEEKKRYDAAIDIEDMTEAKVVMFDTHTKIKQLRKWTESLVAIQSEISNSFLISDKVSIKQVVVPQTVEKKESEPEKKETIHELIQSPQFDTTVRPFLPEPIRSSKFVDSNVPNSFSLLGRTYSVACWDDVLVKLCEAMILKKPYKTLAIGVNKSLQINGCPVLWLDERGESDEFYKLSNGLTVVKNKTSGEIISCCECILNLCGYDCSELKIN